MSLIFNDMSRERRGVVGFIVFIASLAPVSLLLILFAAYVTGKPAFTS
jgi:hypothetical protein